ncbi:Ribosomal protein S24 [Giardia muris]|uniref:Ribosomal protein S24 n=1 Tax=Giardia muris TaxID=5742 RepID=A0A4Z1TA66_GIAMU|nr:Ribosomal protein S24 [Giardia muris]|eukprot:TNJ30127.1 Ribosomal protein S24 [Giardia muris]
MPEITIRLRQVMQNPLLQRQQCVVDIYHPGTTYASKDAVKDRIARELKMKDDKNLILFGFKTVFGGGYTTGFCHAYESADALKRYEPKFRMIRAKLMEPPKPVSRKQYKNLKTRRAKKRGTEKETVVLGAKK